MMSLSLSLFPSLSPSSSSLSLSLGTSFGQAFTAATPFNEVWTLYIIIIYNIILLGNGINNNNNY